MILTCLTNSNHYRASRNRRNPQPVTRSPRPYAGPRFTPARNRATIARFYMMTQTLLSAAAPASQGHLRLSARFARRTQCHRSARSSGRLIANADASSIGILSDQRESKGLSYRSPLRHQRPQLLIANLELEFHLTHTKLSTLRNPNRKFSPFFDSCSALDFCLLVTRHSSLATVLLMHGGAIKTQRNPFKSNNLQISNRRQTGGLRTREPQVSSQLGQTESHSSVESRGPQEEVA